MKRFILVILLLAHQVINQNVTEESVTSLNETTTEENLESTTWVFIDFNGTIATNHTPVPDIVVSPIVTQVLRETFRKYNPFCWRRSYSRSMGPLPNVCPDDTPEQDGFLCYPACRTGYNGVGPFCWQKCDNITSLGFACIGLHISNRSCPWYNKCGLFKSSCISCPKNYKKLGCLCARFHLRDSYGRGVGSALKCSEEYEQVGTFCYNRCEEDFYGAGPMCLQTCPLSHPYDCGLGCSITKEHCRGKVAEMVLSVSVLALKILNNIIGLPFVTSKITKIISDATKYEWAAVVQSILQISLVLAEKLLPDFKNSFISLPLDTVESATKNASHIIVATALQDQPILSPILKIFSLDAVYTAFNNGYCELSNDTLDYIE